MTINGLCCCCSPDRQRLIRKPAPQVFDEARPLIVSGENDKGLEAEPDEPAGDELEFPTQAADTDKPSINYKRSLIIISAGYISLG